MNCIAYIRNKDGGLSIVMPSGATSFDHVYSKDVPKDAINPKVILKENIPIKREYRNIWKIDVNAIIVDETKVEEINK